MYWEVYVYNNYYTSKNNNYCIGVRSYASAIIENNYFKKVKDPIKFIYDIFMYLFCRKIIFLTVLKVHKMEQKKELF